MNIKALGMALAATALLGTGALMGSVIGSASAQTTPQATPAPATPGPKPATTPGTAPSGGPERGRGGPHGGFGPGGPGPAGPGGFGFGQRGGNATTADGANNSITRAQDAVKLANDDLAYAKGKMDTTNVERWLTSADSLIKNAQTAVTGSQYGQASGYAQAAGQLAMLADRQMAQTLGADKLPSYSQRPAGRGNGKFGPGSQPNATITQAQASRLLASTYNHLLVTGTLLKNAAASGDASTYLTEAQNAYKTAYAAYNAGSYSDAASAAHQADELAEVANTLLRAATAPNSNDTPVTVPAPNFT